MSIEYFKQKVKEAKVKYVRDYWLRRLEGAEALQKRLEQQAIVKRKLEQLQASKNSFENAKRPKMKLVSKYPHGCILSWKKPKNWDPDTYLVLVRNVGTKEWRSVATASITSETRTMVLPTRYLSWGSSQGPYELVVAAVKNGIGRKLSKIRIYPTKKDK